MNNEFDCIVIANGLFPTRKEVLDYLNRIPVLIACDGAALELLKQGCRLTAVVGDLDSLPKELRKGAEYEVVHSSEQMTNDLTKAVNYAFERGCRRLLILGATGLREDHTLGNISLLTEYIGLFDRIEMMSDFGVLIPIKKTTRFNSERGQQISIFCITPEVELTTTGLRWEVKDRNFGSWWEGTLNEATGEEFTIAFEGSAKVVVYKAIVDYKKSI